MHYGSSLSLTKSFERIKVLNERTLIGYSGEYSDMQETSRILDELILEDQLETNKNGAMGPVELGHYLSHLHYGQRNKLDPYLNSAIVGGIDFNGDIVLMQVDPFGTFLSGNYFTTAFANYFACSLLRNEYPKNPNDLTKEQAINLLKKCFEVLFYRDSKAGDVIQFTILKNIEKDIEVLNHIKRALTIFHKEIYQYEIRNMIDYINKLENIKIKEYNDDKFYDPIGKLKNFESKAKQIDLIKDFLLFRVIHENTRGIDQEISFRKANEELEEIKRLFEEEKPDINKIYERNKNIFDIIKKKLVNNEKMAENFFQTLKIYFNIGDSRENEETMNDLILLFNSKKYELDLKGIIYFFNYLNKDDPWNKNLSKKYEYLSEMNLAEFKKNLEKLRKDAIYDYQTKNKYSKLFTSLYEKKEAIDFLRQKIDKDISELYDRIDPTNPIITIQNIDDTKKSIEIFNQFKYKKSNKEIFEYIKKLRDDEIIAFESYSKIYSSIIELDKILSKAQEDRISLGKLRQINTRKISHSISLFEVQFLFDYFFSSLKPFKFRHLSFRRPPLEIIVSSLLFSSSFII